MTRRLDCLTDKQLALASQVVTQHYPAGLSRDTAPGFLQLDSPVVACPLLVSRKRVTQTDALNDRLVSFSDGMVVLTDLRLFVFTRRAFRRSLTLRHSLPLLQLSVLFAEVDPDAHQHYRLLLGFHSDTKLLVSSGAPLQYLLFRTTRGIARALVQACASSAFQLAMVRPQQERPSVRLPGELQFDWERPGKTRAAVHAYVAACDMKALPIDTRVLARLQNECAGGELDLSQILEQSPQNSTDLSSRLLCLSFALRAMEDLTSLRAHNLGLAARHLRVLPPAVDLGLHLQRLELVQCELTQPDLEPLLQTLRGFLPSLNQSTPSLRHLNLSGNPLGDAGISSVLLALLQSDTQLHSLQLNHVGMTCKTTPLLSALLACPSWACSLVMLSLNGNALGEPTVLGQALSRSRALRWLSLVDCGLHEANEMIGALQQKSATIPLEYLNLSGNRLSLETFHQMGQLMAKTLTLENLLLQRCALDAFRLEHLFRGLALNKLLKFRVDLSRNALKNRLAQALDQLPEGCDPPIFLLNLSANQLVGSALQHGCLALQKRIPALKQLILDENGDASLASAHAVASLIRQSGLEMVSLRDVGLDDSAHAELLMQLNYEPRLNLSALDLATNHMGMHSFRMLSSLLLTNTTLLDLRVDHNQLGLREVRLLIPAVRRSAIPRNLDMSHDLKRLHEALPSQLQQETQALQDAIQACKITSDDEVCVFLLHEQWPIREQKWMSQNFPPMEIESCEQLHVEPLLAQQSALPEDLLDLYYKMREGKSFISDELCHGAKHDNPALGLKQWFRTNDQYWLQGLDMNKLQLCSNEQHATAILHALAEPERSCVLLLLDVCAETLQYSQYNHSSVEQLANEVTPLLLAKNPTRLEPRNALALDTSVKRFVEYGIQSRIALLEGLVSRRSSSSIEEESVENVVQEQYEEPEPEAMVLDMASVVEQSKAARIAMIHSAIAKHLENALKGEQVTVVPPAADEAPAEAVTET